MLILIKIITAFLFLSYTWICGKIIIQENKKYGKDLLFLSLIFFLFYYLIIFFMNDVLFALSISLAFITFLKLFFKADLFIIMFLSVIIYFINMFSKGLLFVFGLDVFDLFNFSNYSLEKFIFNTISIALSLIIVFIFRKLIDKIISYFVKNKYCHLEILFLFIINSFITIMFNGLSDIYLYVNSFIITTVIVSFLYLIDKDCKMNSVSNYYQEVFEYSRLSDEINFTYREKVHENKNQLVLIKSMINDGKKKDAIKYIDNLLKGHEKDIRNYWLSDLSNIPIAGIKNFINHKLIELQKLDASIEVFVSSEIALVDTKQFSLDMNKDLNTILGVVLDNMIESLKLMRERLASINIYIEDGSIFAEFANNYDGFIDMDKLFKLGYTTKGDGHGVGLTLVKDIIRNSEILDCKPSIIDNFFIQTVSIKLRNEDEFTENH